MNTEVLAFGYIAVAGTDWRQLDDAAKPQRTAIKRLGRRHKVQVKATFKDVINPDTPSLRLREQLAELIAEAQKRNVRLVLLDDLGRLGRDAIEVQAVWAELKKIGVTVESANGSQPTVNLDVSQDRRLQLQRDVRALRTRATTLKNGHLLGRKRYGTRQGSNEAATLRVIVRLRRQLPKSKWAPRGKKMLVRKSFASIAKELNGSGSRRSSGSPWTGASVRNIIARIRPAWLSETRGTL